MALTCPVVIGRGGPRLTQGVTIIKEILESLKLPNKIIVYSLPEAVYGEVKEIVRYGEKFVETIFFLQNVYQ